MNTTISNHIHLKTLFLQRLLKRSYRMEIFLDWSELWINMRSCRDFFLPTLQSFLQPGYHPFPHLLRAYFNGVCIVQQKLGWILLRHFNA